MALPPHQQEARERRDGELGEAEQQRLAMACAVDRGNVIRVDGMAKPKTAKFIFNYLVTLAVCEPCFLNTRVGENSPSLWPTMFSVTKTE